MIIISRENIIAYIKEHIPEFDDTLPAEITCVGEGTPEEDGDGYVNHIYRVRTKKDAYVLKQGLEHARVSDLTMEMSRIKLEYDCLCIRYSLMPEYTPCPILYDPANNLLIMENVSELKVARFQFNKNVIFERFGFMCGRCAASDDFDFIVWALD